MLPCRRFADVLADACARLGADVDRYSFIAVDFHHILLAGLPAHSLALRPAHSRRHLYVTCYTEGFSHFVTSMTAPVASGWSVSPGGTCTHWKAPPVTAHTARRLKQPIADRLQRRGRRSRSASSPTSTAPARRPRGSGRRTWTETSAAS